ncbi:MAG: hypothetical protein PHX51_03800 [Clostridia bacterium]|nr:hypothetical protein [Clostridia bacterium]
MSKKIDQTFDASDVSAGNRKIESFKCSGCGANMVFDPATQKLRCPYCGIEQTVDASKDVKERDFEEFEGLETWTGEIKRVRCENCGAEEVFASDETAKKCSFCGSPKVITLDDVGGVKPNVIVPFRVDKKQASSICAKWVRRRIFAPHKFKKSLSFDGVHGTYFPLWTFDSATETFYNGTLGKTVTRTVRQNGKTVTVTETHWFPVSGSIKLLFDDVIVEGSQRIPQKYFSSVRNFSPSDYVEYNNGFLAGFSAVSYSVSPKEAFDIAKDKMRARIKRAIMEQYHADKVGTLNMDTSFDGKSFKYLMVPIYVTAVSYKDKLYNQFVNGITGKTKGKTPVSAIRVIIAVLLGLGLIALAIWGLGYLPETDNITDYTDLIRLLPMI